MVNDVKIDREKIFKIRKNSYYYGMKSIMFSNTCNNNFFRKKKKRFIVKSVAFKTHIC